SAGPGTGRAAGDCAAGAGDGRGLPPVAAECAYPTSRPAGPSRSGRCAAAAPRGDGGQRAAAGGDADDAVGDHQPGGRPDPGPDAARDREGPGEVVSTTPATTPPDDLPTRRVDGDHR